MALNPTDYFGNSKWGAGSIKSGGGQVSWSFGAVGPAAVDFNFGDEISDPFYKEYVAYAFDVWESIANIDFQLVADTANPAIRVGFTNSADIDPETAANQTTVASRPSSAFDQITAAAIGIDPDTDWLRDPIPDPVGAGLAAEILAQVARILGLDTAPDAASLLNNPAIKPSVGDIAVITGIYGASGYSLTATAGNDRLLADFGDNVQSGLGGNDLIWGYGGADTLNGNDGNDRLDGGSGNDIVNGGKGDDNLFGGIGDDTINGGGGNDTVKASFGSDLVDGGSGNDTIFGGYNNDRLLGGTGNDKLFGEANDDVLHGGAGIDIIAGGTGNDNLTGGLGSDKFIFAAGDAEDWIEDFENGIDKIDLTSFGLANFAEVRALMHQFGGHTSIVFGDGDKLKLIDLKLINIDATDFIL